MLAAMQQQFQVVNYQPPLQHAIVSTGTATVVETRVKEPTRVVRDPPQGWGCPSPRSTAYGWRTCYRLVGSLILLLAGGQGRCGYAKG